MLVLIYPIKNKKDKNNMTTQKQASGLARFIVADFTADTTAANKLDTSGNFYARIVKKA